MIQIVPCANCGHDLHHVAEPHRCQTPGCDCPGLPGRDWPAFWASLTDAEAAACLRAAPRVAGEWETRGRWAVRHGVRERVVALCSEAGARSDKRWRWAMCDDAGSPYGYADTEVEARTACDSALRASGWRVIG